MAHAFALKRNLCYNDSMSNESVNTLFVVGNGFDIHHDINSRYSDYRKWLIDNHKLSHDEDIEGFFNSDCELWSSLEENLSTFDCRSLATEMVSDNPPQLGSEHFESTLTDGVTEVENQMEDWWHAIKSNLNEWVLELKQPNRNKRIYLNADGAAFLTFNYTRTLEDLYKIDSKRILHIHGVKGDSQYEFGHGGGQNAFTENSSANSSNGAVDIDANIEIATNWATSSAKRCFAQWEKPVAEIIRRHKEFFSSLRDIGRVVFLGFGFSKVDKPYVQKIKEMVGPNVRWCSTWYTQQDIDNIQRDLGEDVELLKLEDMIVRENA